MTGWHPRPPLRPEALAEAHPCPVPDCAVLCSPGHVVCRQHWRGIPQRARDPLISAFRCREQDPISFALACDTARSLAAHYAALDAAVPHEARTECALNAR